MKRVFINLRPQHNWIKDIQDFLEETVEYLISGDLDIT